MISNAKIKLIQSLLQKKVRREKGLFFVEGDKMVLDLVCSTYQVVEIFAKPDWMEKHISRLDQKHYELSTVNEKELRRISSLKTPHNVLALAKIPLSGDFPGIRYNELVLALDTIQDPGNFGTIIRTAVWFGIKTLICSPATVDIFNPKVIQASMSALFHINIYYVDLQKELSSGRKKSIPVYGTFPEGTSVYEAALEPDGVILMGNETRGISEDLFPFISHRISIPHGRKSSPVDSLNVSVATAVICSEFRRKYDRDHSK